MNKWGGVAETGASLQGYNMKLDILRKPAQSIYQNRAVWNDIVFFLMKKHCISHSLLNWYHSNNNHSNRNKGEAGKGYIKWTNRLVTKPMKLNRPWPLSFWVNILLHIYSVNAVFFSTNQIYTQFNKKNYNLKGVLITIAWQRCILIRIESYYYHQYI